MYQTPIGDFNIELMRFEQGESGFVRLWTDADIDSPFGHEWLNELTVGPEGTLEIIDIDTGNHFIVVELNASVQTERKAKRIIGTLMQIITSACLKHATDDEGNLDEAALDDLKQLLASDKEELRRRIRQAAATDSIDTTGLMPSRYGYADG